MRIVELFSGIGSQKKALVNLNIEHEVLATCEWDMTAIIAYALMHHKERYNGEYDHLSKVELLDTLSKNYNLSLDSKNSVKKTTLNTMSPEILRVLLYSIKLANNFTSITNVSAQDLCFEEGIDVMTYSFPCQDLSNMGNFHRENLGIDRDSGNKSSLLWEVERILFELSNKEIKLPKVLLMENVTAIDSPRHKKNFDAWRKNLETLGYHNFTYKLNSLDFGSCQNRNRMFMLSIYIGEDYLLKDKLIKYEESNSLYQYKVTNNFKLEEVLKVDYSNRTLYKEALASKPNKTPSRDKIFKNNILLYDGVTYHDGFVPTITTRQDRHPNSGVLVFEDYFRFLTPRELFLLMGFSESDIDILYSNQMSYRKRSELFSRDRLFRLAGNSIVVNVLEALFIHIDRFISIIDNHYK
ncbi:DNA cytosine methyltransferase [Mycoplasmatota bacterium zrk1]